jgi:hypothetical protein
MLCVDVTDLYWVGHVGLYILYGKVQATEAKQVTWLGHVTYLHLNKYKYKLLEFIIKWLLRY